MQVLSTIKGPLEDELRNQYLSNNEQSPELTQSALHEHNSEDRILFVADSEVTSNLTNRSIPQRIVPQT